MRAVGVIALALVVCLAALWLGRWQYQRHEARAADIAAYEAASAHAPAPLGDVVPGAADVSLGDAVLDGASAVRTALPPGAAWRIVEVDGHFADAEPTWLRNRPVHGTPAVHALEWFLTDDGRALLVNAGWVDARGSARPTLPTGPLTLTVALRAFEDDDGRRDSGATRITPVQVDAPPGYDENYARIGDDAGADVQVVPGYGVVAEACEPCGPLPGLTPTPLPVLSLGPHLAYAWQWWMLAVAAPVIAIILVRRDRDEAPGLRADGDVGTDGSTPQRPGRPRPARRRSGPTDEEIEDAL